MGNFSSNTLGSTMTPMGGTGPMAALSRGRAPSPTHALHAMVRGTHPLTARMSPAVRSVFARGLILGHLMGQQSANGPQQP